MCDVSLKQSLTVVKQVIPFIKKDELFLDHRMIIYKSLIKKYGYMQDFPLFSNQAILLKKVNTYLFII